MSHIDAVADERERMKKKRVNEKRGSCHRSAMDIKDLAPRIRNIMAVARKLWERRILIGGDLGRYPYQKAYSLVAGVGCGDIGLLMDRARSWKPDCVRACYPYAFGIEDDPFLGPGIMIDEDGDVVSETCGDDGITLHKIPHDELRNRDDRKMKYILREFDAWEKEFYEYIKNLEP